MRKEGRGGREKEVEEGEKRRWKRERKGGGGGRKRKGEEGEEGEKGGGGGEEGKGEEFMSKADGHALCCLAVCDTPSNVR